MDHWWLCMEEPACLWAPQTEESYWENRTWNSYTDSILHTRTVIFNLGLSTQLESTKRPASEWVCKGISWKDYLRGEILPAHSSSSLGIRMSEGESCCCFACSSLPLASLCISPAAPAAFAPPAVIILCWDQNPAPLAFQHELKTSGPQQSCTLSVADWDCWGIQPLGLSSYWVLTLFSVKIATAGPPWLYSVRWWTNSLWIYTYSISSSPLEIKCNASAHPGWGIDLHLNLGPTIYQLCSLWEIP